MKGANGVSGFLIWHCIVWWPVVPAIYVAMEKCCPCPVHTDSRDLDGRMSGFPSAAGIYLANGISGLNGSENLGNAAERLLSGMRETHYQHSTHVDRAGGVYDMDCSGFVDYLMKRVAPAQFAQRRNRARPCTPASSNVLRTVQGVAQEPLTRMGSRTKARRCTTRRHHRMAIGILHSGAKGIPGMLFHRRRCANRANGRPLIASKSMTRARFGTTMIAERKERTESGKGSSPLESMHSVNPLAFSSTLTRIFTESRSQ